MQVQQENLWTDRWTPIREQGRVGLTGPRLQYWECKKRFQVIAAGGRSLKTEIAKRKLAKRAMTDVFLNPKGYVNERYFFGAPTHRQVKAIGWDDLRAMIPREFIARTYWSDLCVKLTYGPEIWCVGLDQPQRLEGSPWNGGVISEFADIKAGTWDANFRPLLADRAGSIILEGRPDFEKPNNEKFKELFDYAQSGIDEDWAAFQWKSADVLPISEVESARRSMSPTMFRQEFEGSFENAPGRAYLEFVVTVHVNDRKAIEESVYRDYLPLGISCDFNFEHHNWGLYQTTPQGDTIAIDEIYEQNATVEVMLKSLDGVLNKLNPRNIVFYGDYSGNNRSAQATFSAWRQIRNHFDNMHGRRDAEFRYDKQPPISDRINKVNGKLRNAAGEVHFYANKKCVNLIRDMEKVTRSMLFGQNKGGDLTHASDNLGYYICQYER